MRASYHPSFLPPETRLAPPAGGGILAADQLACECSECAQYLLRCSNETITETETLVTDIELYDKRKHPKERKLFNSETPEVSVRRSLVGKFFAQSFHTSIVKLILTTYKLQAIIFLSVFK